MCAAIFVFAFVLMAEFRNNRLSDFISFHCKIDKFCKNIVTQSLQNPAIQAKFCVNFCIILYKIFGTIVSN